MSRGHGRSRNIQSFQGGPFQRNEISRDPLPMDTLQSGRHMSRPSSLTTNRRTQTSRDVLQSARFSTSYDQERITEEPKLLEILCNQ
jgi:hypothetical protein